MTLAGEGDASAVDLLVRDIYGGDYEEFGLSADIVAASLGKLTRPKDRQEAKPCDLARGILDAITNNVVCFALKPFSKNRSLKRNMFGYEHLYWDAFLCIA
eukprot:m.83360 g.83360  ORF g.83360 m.83360 type:complete len:101 (+) comp14342_c2_seq4:914-1216(+)